MKRIVFAAFLLACPALADETHGNAQNNPDETAYTLETVRVYGRGLNLQGEAGAASEGVVGYDDFKDRPLSRVGELVEVIPGVVATQHSGEGKANQYFLRGFNLDHGTDFSVAVDGVPVNLRTHGHGQGYLDLNFVIPEVVERVDFRKGPYFADAGDFSAAGSARYKTYDTLEDGFALISFGEGNYLRGVTAGSTALSANTDLLLAAEAQSYDGAWALDQDLQKLNGFAKLTHQAGPAQYQLLATAYQSEWTSTDQIPQRAVRTGLIDRFGFVDDDLGGETSRFSLVGQARFNHEAGSETHLSAYAVSYDFRLYSNFTYFLDDPVNGDEFEQRDRRWYYGASAQHQHELTDTITLNLGGNVRYDDIADIGLFRTAGRERLSTVREDAVTELSTSVFGEAEFNLSPTLRARLGVRGDYYEADVDALSLSGNSGSADDSLISPSATLAWRATENVELYANYGRGFHSNDVRGATIRIDPNSGEPAETVPLLVQADGAELGARWDQGNLSATVALFWLSLDSELVFVGDGGTTEPNDGSERTGIETSLFWRPNDWLVADASAAYTDAEFDIPGSETEIPGAVESVFSAGLSAHLHPFTLSSRLRHFGEAPLIEDGSVTSQGATILNLSGQYEWQRFTFGLEILNALDTDDNDIEYFFESQLPGESEPVEDIHFHPVEPRQVRASLRYRF